MQLTDNEARFLINELYENLFWSDDPLHEIPMNSYGILSKLVEAFPEQAESVREEKEMERLQHIEAHKQHMKESDDNE